MVAEGCGVEGDAEFFPVLGFVDAFADDFFDETFGVEAVDLASEAVTVFNVRHLPRPVSLESVGVSTAFNFLVTADPNPGSISCLITW